MEKIHCEYCDKLISKNQIKRHQNTKQCRNKQLNKDIILPIKEYSCKYCNKLFNRSDDKNEHELLCTSKDMYYKFQIEFVSHCLDFTIKKNRNLRVTNELIDFSTMKVWNSQLNVPFSMRNHVDLIF